MTINLSAHRHKKEEPHSDFNQSYIIVLCCYIRDNKIMETATCPQILSERNDSVIQSQSLHMVLNATFRDS
jgi:hypothetical protein